MEDKSQKSSACWSCLSSPPREDLLREIPMGGNWEREPEGEAGRAAGLTLRGREREGSVVRRKHLGPQCSLERRQRLLGSPPASVPDRGGSGLPVLGWEQPVGSRPWGRGSTGLASTAAGALGHPDCVHCVICFLRQRVHRSAGDGEAAVHGGRADGVQMHPGGTEHS